MEPKHMDWATIGTTVASVATIIGFFFTWMNGNINRLDNDVRQIIVRMDANTSDFNAKWIAANARTDLLIKNGNDRFDAINKASSDRFDAITDRIDRMLEKQAK